VHPSNEKLKEVLKNANSWKSCYDKVLIDIVKKCDTCIRYKRNPSKPLAYFNDLLTIDLKKWGDGWIVYFIDYFSRLVVAKYVKRKYPREVLEAFMSGGLRPGYGIPVALLVDNGGKLTGAEIVEMTSFLGIKVHTTATCSPFSNGVCEKNHGVVDHMT
jgi:transposase InsO family protein